MEDKPRVPAVSVAGEASESFAPIRELVSYIHRRLDEEDSPAVPEEPEKGGAPQPPGWIRSGRVVPRRSATLRIAEARDWRGALSGGVFRERGASLAWYRPFHLSPEKGWGIYLRAVGILCLAGILEEGPLRPGSPPSLRASELALRTHEEFHLLVESAIATAEVLLDLPIYSTYVANRDAELLEEALANARAMRAISRRFPGFAAPLGRRLSELRPGARDFGRWVGRAYSQGLCRCEEWILDAAERRFCLQLGIETFEFSFGKRKTFPQPPTLFRPVRRSRIPTYLVIEPEGEAWVETNGAAGRGEAPAPAELPKEG